MGSVAGVQSGFEAIESLHEGGGGALVLGRIQGEGPVVAFVPDADDAGRMERDRLLALAGPAVPEPADARTDVVILRECSDARPLHRWGPMPAPALRAAAVRLLSCLSHVHSRGLLHGRIDRGWILADPSGGVWLTGWSQAREPRRSPRFSAETDDGSADVAAVAQALLFAAIEAPWPDPGGPEGADARREAVARVAVHDGTLARVLGRLAEPDTFGVVPGAAEALAELGEPDLSLPEPWDVIPLVGRRRHVDAALRHVAQTAQPSERVASLDFVGPSGAGRTRLLREIGRRAEALGIAFVGAEARAGTRGFGALTELVRRLAARVPPDDTAGRRAVDAALRAFEDTAFVAGPAGAPPREAITALVDLVRAAAGAEPVILGLDDADLLPPAAREAWDALGRYIEAVGDAEGRLRVLLVTTSAGAPEPESGVRRVRRTLHDWGRVHIHGLLARILADRGAAAVLAEEVHRAVGGRPADVVEALRDLERHGALVAVGRAWKYIEGVRRVDQAAPGGHVRRALESVGRDALALIEVVAAAGELRLHRAELAELAELPAQRIGAAAETAIRAGLLVRNGPAWSLRTECLRRKVEAAIPIDRRRLLHLELLNRLDESDPDALPKIARHAILAGDPRAGDRARRAAVALRRTGRPAEAAEILDAAAAEGALGQGPDAWDDRLLLAEARIEAGLVATALADLERMLADPGFPTDRHAAAILLRARGLRLVVRFRSLSELAMPPAGSAPLAFARVRYFRAMGFASIFKTPEARREMRLAAAEIDDPASAAEAEYERLQAEHLIAVGEHRHTDAHVALVRLLTHARARATPAEQARLLGSRANLARLDREYRRAEVWVNAARRLLARAHNPPAMVVHIETTAALVVAMLGRPVQAMRLRNRAWLHALRGSGEVGATTARIRMIVAKVWEGTATIEDIAFARRLAQSALTMPAELFDSVADRLAEILLDLSLQSELELVNARAGAQPDERLSIAMLHGRLALGLSIDLEEVNSKSDGVDVTRLLLLSCSSRSRPDSNVMHSLAAIAVDEESALAVSWAARASLCGLRTGPIPWDIEVLVEVLEQASGRFWAIADAAACLYLTLPCHARPDHRERLARIATKSLPMMPPAVAWRLELARAVESARAGRIGQTRESLKRARQRLGTLGRPEFGECGRDALARGSQFLESVVKNIAPLLGQLDRSPIQINIGEPKPTVPGFRARISQTWLPVRKAVEASRRSILVSPHLRELELFGEDFVSRGKGRHLMREGSFSPVPEEVMSWAVLVAPSLWDERHVSEAVKLLRCATNETRVVMLALSSGGRIDPGCASFRTLIEFCGGTIVRLESPLEAEQNRALLFEDLIADGDSMARLTHEAMAQVNSYEWSGGLGELESVVGEVLSRGAPRIDRSTLACLGWENRALLSGLSRRPPLQREILAAVSAGDVGIAEVAQATKRPARTVLRALRLLLDSGQLERIGRGRATRYRLRGGSEVRS